MILFHYFYIFLWFDPVFVLLKYHKQTCLLHVESKHSENLSKYILNYIKIVN